jgi:hypothetical protein
MTMNRQLKRTVHYISQERPPFKELISYILSQLNFVNFSVKFHGPKLKFEQHLPHLIPTAPHVNTADVSDFCKFMTDREIFNSMCVCTRFYENRVIWRY